jgi:hypothetical protein
MEDVLKIKKFKLEENIFDWLLTFSSFLSVNFIQNSGSYLAVKIMYFSNN